MQYVILFSAFLLGAFHALEPGHGKSVMAAFVLGTDANICSTLTLGFTVVFSHIIVILLMGILSLYLSNYFNLGSLSSTMELIGGVILLLVGIWILKSYYKPHVHKIDTNKSAIAIGLSAGLIPCPAALAVLLISISSGVIVDGLLYVIIFSLGLAVSISLFSILFVKSKDFLEKYVSNNSINKLPLISGIIIILFGIWNIAGPLFGIH
ncbi:ABC-type nickel/cobalt efflux system permease component RcnA [Methanococcus voltae PS]|uniref:ABC-type nickel/cobalt efflux system permease component RcnA n=1 Tax=Methanococcus voltae PS TaxID=523842 RepID=A0ABT2EWF1_METVO|nr:sulfite exporter TauE/SafE family protein [Methanococcus voltae]MCS3922281.1 ABC-type nickel/cobalt efflux system permease component RcnA [Methanococcus voltae PS]